MVLAVMINLDERFDKRMVLGFNVFESCRIRIDVSAAKKNLQGIQEVLEDLYRNVASQSN